MGKSFLQAFVIFTFLSAASVAAQQPDAIDQFASHVSKFTLKNGMRVLVVERPIAPIISFCAYIRTGGIDDETGRSGLAHMFEHMLFKGTKTIGTKNYQKEKDLLDQIDRAQAELQSALDSGNSQNIEALQKKVSLLNKQHEGLVVPEEFWQIYESAGAQGLNAATGYDFTNYVVSLPKNQIKLWMEMESDRIRNPVLREFYKERNVVMEERRMRVDTSANGKLWENFLATAFVAHPYGRPILGWESEISRVTRNDAEDFFARHYDVSRLVITIVGDVKVADIEKLMKKYFESIPAKKNTDISRYATEPVQEGERRIEVLFDAEPSLIVGYHRPSMQHADEAALSVTSDLLSNGYTSRFNQDIVEKKRLAISVWSESNTPGERDASVFVAGGTPLHPHTVNELEAAITDEIEKLKKTGPSPEELDKVKNNAFANLIHGMDSNSDVANQLCYYESVGGDWHMLIKLIRAVQNVTADDVKRVMNTYLIPSNKTVAYVTKKAPVELSK